ncbi:MAG: hypothetical protein HQL29_05450 [Candidatus Omnitrophica bacterium]|nr:hypothetical protein [Candidatus Omnitrophota bacterium]
MKIKKTNKNKPKIGISRFLLAEKCRWDGDIVSYEAVEKMKAHVKFIPVCPKMEKGKSPSCGIEDVKVYGSVDSDKAIEKTSGFFSKHILENYKNLPIETVERLEDPTIMKNFLLSLS